MAALLQALSSEKLPKAQGVEHLPSSILTPLPATTSHLQYSIPISILPLPFHLLFVCLLAFNLPSNYLPFLYSPEHPPPSSTSWPCHGEESETGFSQGLLLCPTAQTGQTADPLGYIIAGWIVWVGW